MALRFFAEQSPRCGLFSPIVESSNELIEVELFPLKVRTLKDTIFGCLNLPCSWKFWLVFLWTLSTEQGEHFKAGSTFAWSPLVKLQGWENQKTDILNHPYFPFLSSNLVRVWCNCFLRCCLLSGNLLWLTSSGKSCYLALTKNGHFWYWVV